MCTCAGDTNGCSVILQQVWEDGGDYHTNFSSTVSAYHRSGTGCDVQTQVSSFPLLLFIVHSYYHLLYIIHILWSIISISYILIIILFSLFIMFLLLKFFCYDLLSLLLLLLLLLSYEKTGVQCYVDLIISNFHSFSRGKELFSRSANAEFRAGDDSVTIDYNSGIGNQSINVSTYLSITMTLLARLPSAVQK